MTAQPPAPTQPRTLAPGARVVVRDEEWIVRSVKQATYGGDAVHVTGVSELVRGKQAIFLSELDTIQELRPEETALVHDESPRYRKSRLYLESLLRRTPPTDTALYVGHRGAIQATEFQLQPAAKALTQLRPRILMADGVGLGKTIEVGVLLSELIRRGRGDRILVVALKSILTQFQEELWARFTIPLVRLDSVGIQRVQSKIPSNMNPFYYFHRVIISVDTLKKDEKYRRYLEQCRWDVVVIDECQNVAVRTTGGSSRKSQRAKVAQLLARTTDALILTSATPHDGKAESFASLMNLLEPTAVANESEYTSDEVKDYFLRRFKKDVAHEIGGAFHERRLKPLREPASPAENAVFDALSTITFKTINRVRNNQGVLFRTLLLKGFLSSPHACMATIDERLKHKNVVQEGDPAAEHDRHVLTELRTKLQAVTKADFSKYGKLVDLLKDLKIDASKTSERVVIFSERIATLNFLADALKKDLKLKPEQVAVFHGTLDDTKQQALVKGFGTESSPIRILLASDAASEGVNLHFYCHQLVHFDLPWSLITLEQRNGRIDRFGQEKEPVIHYLLTIPGQEKLRGDLRILDRLIEKEQEAHKNLGDVAWLLNLHEAEQEEEHLAKGIEEGQAPEIILPDEPKKTDFMDLLLGDDGPSDPHATTNKPLRLYESDLAYARDALETVLEDGDGHVEWHDAIQGLTLSAPDDLLRRFDFLPRELSSDGNRFKLTADRSRVMQALEDARQDESRWPEWQLFWELHPIAEWLDDRVLAGFTRHEAPVLRVAQGLEPGDRVFVIQGLISNGRSQPTITDWFGIRFRDGAQVGVQDLRELIEVTGLHRTASNPGGELPDSVMKELNELLPEAVTAAEDHMKQLRLTRMATIGAPLKEGLSRLTAWSDRRKAMIEARKAAIRSQGRKLRSDEERRFRDELTRIRKLHEEREDWIQEGMKTVKEPYLRVAAVLVPLET